MHRNAAQIAGFTKSLWIGIYTQSGQGRPISECSIQCSNTQKLWVLNKQRQAFVQVVQQGQNRVPQTWLPITGLGGDDNRSSDLHQLSGISKKHFYQGRMGPSE
jgi:hypothetical protein